MNPPPGPILSNTNLVHPQSRGGPLAYVPSPLANSASLRYSAADTLPFSSQSLPSSSQADLRHGTYSSSPLHLDTNEARTSSSPSPAVLRQPTLSAISTRANSNGTHKHTGSGFAQIQALPTYPDLLKKTSLPKSSPPTSSAQSIPRLPTLPSSASDDEQASALLLSLRELTALYDLPPSVLEQLVGEVVREDGFVKLVRAKLIIYGTLRNIRADGEPQCDVEGEELCGYLIKWPLVYSHVACGVRPWTLY